MLFRYKARDQSGVLRQGEIEAESQPAVYSILKKEGLVPFFIKEKGAGKKFEIPFFGRVSIKDLAIFTKELQVMVKAGLPLVAALKALGEQVENKRLAEVSLKLAEMVEGGTALSSALSNFPSVFSPLYISIIKSGEKSGKLEDMLLSLTEQLEKTYELMSKIRGVMIYPAFVLAALFGVVVILLIYVIPALTKLFEEIGGTLPFATIALIKTSNFVLKFWWLLLLMVFGLYGCLILYRRTVKGRRNLDKFKIKLPLFGSLMKKIYIARFCRTSSTLIKAGLPVLEVLKTSRDVLGNIIYQEEIEKVEKLVEGGLSLSAALKESAHFPVMVNQLISVGETSGSIEDSLDTLADFFEKEVTVATAALASLIEPVLIIIIGLGVGFAIVSVIKPIYTLSEVL